MSNITPFSNENKILTIRGLRVMTDKDVAEALGTDVKHLNENAGRSPKWEYLREQDVENEYRFQLTKEEAVSMWSQFATTVYSNTYPYVYTQKGCAYFGTSMNNPKACQLAVELSTAFVAVQAIKDVMNDPNASALDKLELVVKALREKERQQAELQVFAQKTANELAKTNGRVDTLETNFDDIKNKVKNRTDDYFTVAGYASLIGIPRYDNPRANADGKAAAALSNANKIGYYGVKDPRYGKVNCYHISILRAIFSKEVV
jgi:hypothetical protein